MSKAGDNFLNLIQKDLKSYVKDLSTQVFEGVVTRTPILTGQTRASWNMTEGSADTSTVDVGGEDGNPLPMPETPDLYLSSEYPVVHVTNGKSHAVYLEDGTPKMSPAAMVAATLASIRK